MTITNQPNYVDSLPLELIPSIFRHLKALDFAISLRVCKLWKSLENENLWQELLSNELEGKSYLPRVFNGEDWEKHHGIKTRVLYPHNFCHALDKKSPFFENMTVGDSSFIQCKVAEVSNCKTLVDLLKKHSTGYFKNEIKTVNLLEKETALGMRDWIIMPDTNLPDSIEKTLADQSKLFHPPYRIATIFETSLVFFNRLISSGEQTLRRDPPLYTRCIATSIKTDEKHFIAGGWAVKTQPLMVMPYDRENETRNTGIIPLMDL